MFLNTRGKNESEVPGELGHISAVRERQDLAGKRGRSLTTPYVEQLQNFIRNDQGWPGDGGTLYDF